MWILLPLLALLVVAAWAGAVRLGPAVPPPSRGQADAVVYASAVARIYERAGARRRLARTLARGFLQTLIRHLRLRRSALPAEILAAVGAPHTMSWLKRIFGKPKPEVAMETTREYSPAEMATLNLSAKSAQLERTRVESFACPAGGPVRALRSSRSRSLLRTTLGSRTKAFRDSIAWQRRHDACHGEHDHGRSR